MRPDFARQLARFVGHFPDFRVFRRYQQIIWIVRAALLRGASGVEVGSDVKIDSRFYYPSGLEITMGAGVHIKRDVRVGAESDYQPDVALEIGSGTEVLSGVRLDCTGGITIGKNSHIGRESTIYSHRHDTSRRDVPILQAPIEESPVVIGDDVMIYSEVVVLPGVTIGDGAVVAVRAVVTEDIAPYSIVGGVPARVIGERI